MDRLRRNQKLHLEGNKYIWNVKQAFLKVESSFGRECLLVKKDKMLIYYGLSGDKICHIIPVFYSVL
jgi:hypothetical protein